MTFLEVLVIVSGLGLGYWLVTVFTGSREDDGQNTRNAAPESGVADSPTRWFDVLGVSEAATKEEVAAAYRERIAQYHPDKVATMGPEIRSLAESKATQINAAYREAKRLK